MNLIIKRKNSCPPNDALKTRFIIECKNFYIEACYCIIKKTGVCVYGDLFYHPIITSLSNYYFYNGVFVGVPAFLG